LQASSQDPYIHFPRNASVHTYAAFRPGSNQSRRGKSLYLQG
jgi:hypothetical protein